ncbi:MAG: hypothetical protein ACI3XS_04750 [Eubacteriales bacterium]
MEWLKYIQIICGFGGLFFGLLAMFTYFRIKKICSTYTEEELQSVMPMIKKQSKRINIYVLLLFVLTVAALIINYTVK